MKFFTIINNSKGITPKGITAKELAKELDDLNFLYSNLNNIIVDYAIDLREETKGLGKALYDVINKIPRSEIIKLSIQTMMRFKFVSQAWDAFSEDRLIAFLKENEKNCVFCFFIHKNSDSLDDVNKQFKYMWSLTCKPWLWQFFTNSGETRCLEDQENIIKDQGDQPSPQLFIFSLVSYVSKFAETNPTLLDRLAALKHIHDLVSNEDSSSQRQTLGR